MVKESQKKSVYIIFQAIILVGMIFSLAALSMPKLNSIKAVLLFMLLIISYAAIIFFMVRLNCKNVKKWEIILYSALNIVFVTIIVVCIVQLSFISSGQSSDADKREGIGLGSLFWFCLLGVPQIILALIFGIISIIRASVSKNNAIQEIIKTKEIKNSKEFKVPETNFCRFCGKQIEQDSKFCKFCGKQIK